MSACPRHVRLVYDLQAYWARVVYRPGRIPVHEDTYHESISNIRQDGATYIVFDVKRVENHTGVVYPHTVHEEPRDSGDDQSMEMALVPISSRDSELIQDCIK